jgi:hypothetical protein
MAAMAEVYRRMGRGTIFPGVPEFVGVAATERLACGQYTQRYEDQRY